MGIKWNEEKQHYVVRVTKRHPTLNSPRSIVRQGIKTLAEAERVHRELHYKIAEKFHNERFPRWPMFVQRFIEFFETRGHARSTVQNYLTGLRARTFEPWRMKQIDKITTMDIRHILEVEMKDDPQATRKNLVKYLKAAFDYAIEEGILARNPVPVFKFKKNVKIKLVLKEHELRKFLKLAKEENHPWYPIWAVACYTGMRSGELYALSWNDVDLEERKFIVRRSFNRVNGYKETKSGDDRIIEIAEPLINLLLELQKSNEEYVLPHFQDWTSGNQSKVLKLFLAKHELPLIRFHDLRASWATILLSKGVPAVKVMSAGGWKELKTMQIYLRKAGINSKGIMSFINLT